VCVFNSSTLDSVSQRDTLAALVRWCRYFCDLSFDDLLIDFPVDTFSTDSGVRDYPWRWTVIEVAPDPSPCCCLYTFNRPGFGPPPGGGLSLWEVCFVPLCEAISEGESLPEISESAGFPDRAVLLSQGLRNKLIPSIDGWISECSRTMTGGR